MNQKFIITGAPGTGKTSIINELKKRGFSISKEISREIIADELKQGGDQWMITQLTKLDEAQE